MDASDFEASMERLRKERALLPEAVACMHRTPAGIRYDAELSVNGIHYIVDTGWEERADAIKEAQKHVDAIRAEYEKVSVAYIAKFNWPQAKE